MLDAGTGAGFRSGPGGPPNTLAIGTVTTGAAGSQAAATITGASPAQSLNLTIPKGDQGAAGPTPWQPPKAWVAGLVCVASAPATTVVYGSETYVCIGSHIAGIFANDLVAGLWIKVAQKGVDGINGTNGSNGANGVQPWQTPPVAWAATTAYTATAPASCVTYGGGCYVCSTAHTSGASFDATKWTLIASAAGALLAANNLSDLANAGTARTNLGLSIVPRGYISGLTLSNDATTPASVLDIAAGKARDSTDAADLVLASAFTKKVSTAWAAGTGNGALDTGAIAAGWYHVWLIGRTDGTARDILVSLSATAPTMPSGYTFRRRIGAFQWASSAILPFTQVGDEFLLAVPISDVATTIGTAASLLTISTPTGLKVRAIVEGSFNNGAGNVAVLVTSPDTTDTAPAAPTLGITGGNYTSGVSAYGNFALQVRTNTASQIRARSTAASSGFYLTTKGWLDRRGQDD